jgi:hypothetical protein
MKGVYTIDERSSLRKSHLNPDVQKLYKEFLGKPLSHESHKYLHTTYFPRGSLREKLAVFLDAVDRRDGKAVKELFEDTGIWDTAGPLGIIPAQEVESVISNMPRLVHPHRLAASEGLNVIDSFGNLVHFDIELGAMGKIQTLRREIISQ